MISELASVAATAVIGADVSIGPFTVVHANVILGEGVSIDSHCVIGYPTPLANGAPLRVGGGAVIRSHSVFYEGSTFGPGLRTGHHVTVRERIDAGIGLQVGTLSDLQGDTRIGDHVRTHSRVFIAKYSSIADFVWIFPSVVIANDPHPPSDVAQRGADIEEFAVIGAGACVMPGVVVGARSVVGAASLVTKNVEPDVVVGGVPAKPLMPTKDVLLRDGSGRSAYPWMRRFHRGYPDDVVARWRAVYGEPDADDT